MGQHKSHTTEAAQAQLATVALAGVAVGLTVGGVDVGEAVGLTVTPQQWRWRRLVPGAFCAIFHAIPLPWCAKKAKRFSQKKALARTFIFGSAKARFHFLFLHGMPRNSAEFRSIPRNSAE